MNLTGIRYFVAAARYENFTEASASLYIAQPNLSKRIASLENELGVLLFHRRNKTVRLTSAGKYLYKEFSAVLDQIDSAIDVANIIQRKEENIVSIGILDGQEISNEILNRLNSFSEKNPDVELRLERNGFSNLRKGLLTGKYDIVITLDFGAAEIPDTYTVIVQSQKSAIAINKNNPIANMKDPSIEMLKDESFVAISPEESSGGYEGFIYTCEQYGFQPHIVNLANSLENLLLCVESGIGIALLDENIRLGKNPHIKIIPIDNVPANIVACALRSSITPMVSELVNVLNLSSYG